MLSMLITRRSRTESDLEVTRHLAGASSLVANYSAVGFIPVSGAFGSHRVILNDTFDRDDVRLFGRHGIIELSHVSPEGVSSDNIAPLYISGGREEASMTPVSSLLRLSREDHRQLIFLLRSDPDLAATVSPDSEFIDESPSSTSSHAGRFSQIVGKAAAIGSPFVFTSVVAAQCHQPNDGGTYASGNTYTGIDSSHIQQQEGGNTVGTVPTNSSGVTTSGMDWGQHTASDARNLGISQSTINQFSPFLAKGPGQPLIGQSARNVMAQYPSTQFTLSAPQQQQIYASVYPKYYSAAGASFNSKAAAQGINFQFSQLNVQWQTAFASMFFQAAGGNPSGSGGSRFMNTQFASQVIAQNWSGAMANLKSYQSTSAENNRALSNYNYLQKAGCTSGTQ